MNFRSTDTEKLYQKSARRSNNTQLILSDQNKTQIDSLPIDT